MKINITPEEFTSIIIIYLLDKINNEEEIVPNNENFNKLLENLQRVKSQITKFYLNTELDNRIYYKRLRSVLEREGIDETFTINIIKENETNESENINKLHEEESKISHAETKELVKDVIKRIRKRKFRKATYMSDEELDKIIAKAIKDKGDE